MDRDIEQAVSAAREAEALLITAGEDTFQALPPLPACPHCHALARPNILMFGDGSWNPRRTDAQQMALQHWLHGLTKAKATAVVVELGAGTAIATVRHFSETVAVELGATLVRINPREPIVPRGGVGLRLGAAEGLTRICERL